MPAPLPPSLTAAPEWRINLRNGQESPTSQVPDNRPPNLPFHPVSCLLLRQHRSAGRQTPPATLRAIRWNITRTIELVKAADSAQWAVGSGQWAHSARMALNGPRLYSHHDSHTFVWQYIHMAEPSFEWDDAKDRVNQTKRCNVRDGAAGLPGSAPRDRS